MHSPQEAAGALQHIITAGNLMLSIVNGQSALLGLTDDHNSRDVQADWLAAKACGCKWHSRQQNCLTDGLSTVGYI